MDQLRFYLARLRRRLRLCDGWMLAQQTLWMVGLLLGLIQLAGRLWPLSFLGVWMWLPFVFWLVGIGGYTLLKPMPLGRIACRVDLELGLKERLSTAWAFQSVSGEMVSPALLSLQRQDALNTAQRIEPHRSFPLRWQRRALLLAAVLLAAAVASMMLPNPMDAVLQKRAAIARAAEEQAKRIQELRAQVEQDQRLSPEERQDLLRQLDKLARQLEANPGDREKALADLSRLEEALRPRLDLNADARQAALESLAAQLQSLSGESGRSPADPAEMDQALQALAEQLAQMSDAERTAAAQALAQMAARAAQSGDATLAQALASLAQAAQSGDSQAAETAAQAAAQAMRQAQSDLDRQAALQRTLSQLQSSRQAIAQAGQNPGQGQDQGQGQQGQQGQGQGQGQQVGGGGGTQANQLPPASRTGQAGRPQGQGRSSDADRLDQQVYVPWNRRPGSGDELFISGQDTGQGDTQTRASHNPLPGAPGEALLPYHQVYYDYLDAAGQAIEASYIPIGLKEYVKSYFSRLEP